MLFRPKRTARVTTKQEFDSAFKSADQVIVEGDDQLLSYAVSRASDDEDSHLAVATHGPLSAPVDVGAPAAAPGGFNAMPALAPSPAFAPSNDDFVAAAPPPAAHAVAGAASRAEPRHKSPATILYLLIPVLAVVGLVYFTAPSPQEASAPVPHAATAPPPVSEGAAPHQDPAHPLSGHLLEDKVSKADALNPRDWAWPVVSIFAITALFLIARQAITGGRNLEISWKVTEKVTGRVVITKVNTRMPKARKTA